MIKLENISTHAFLIYKNTQAEAGPKIKKKLRTSSGGILLNETPQIKL